MDEVSIDNRNNSCNSSENKRREMINEIRALNFSIIELGLYLDTHPEDKRALDMQNKYAEHVTNLKEKYQRLYGALTIYYPWNEWRWIDNPWPWERGNF